MKLEEIVVSTNTGRSPIMVDYYRFWEQKIFAALTEMVSKALSSLQAMFQSKKVQSLFCSHLSEVVCDVAIYLQWE
jgi:hypothetical protein